MDQQTAEKPSWLQLESVIPLESTDPATPTVKTVTTLSADTITREYPEFIVRPSPKRVGMKLKHALAIANKKQNGRLMPTAR